MENSKIKEVLQLAGQLANVARIVTKANAKYLSKAIVDMEDILNEYDQKVFSNDKDY